LCPPVTDQGLGVALVHGLVQAVHSKGTQAENDYQERDDHKEDLQVGR
jgi:hypothetical protein